MGRQANRIMRQFDCNCITPGEISRYLIADKLQSETLSSAPTSHLFVERRIGLCRQEFLGHVMFWNAKDLARKLGQYQNYYNETRAHSSLNKKTPNQKAANDDIPNRVESL